jgi:hypothetical protein
MLYCADYRAAKAAQKSIVAARRVQRTNQGRTPFFCTNQPTKEGPRDLIPLYSLSPYSAQFRQSTGATPLYLSGCDYGSSYIKGGQA